MPTACTFSAIVSSGSAARASGSSDCATAAPVSGPDSRRAIASVRVIAVTPWMPRISVIARSMSSGKLQAHSGPGLPRFARNDEFRLGRHRLVEVFRDLVEEARGRQPALVGADEQREILGHVAVLDGLHADLLQRIGKLRKLRIVVELGAVTEAPRPGEDGSDRIGRGFLALLMLTIVPR